MPAPIFPPLFPPPSKSRRVRSALIAGIVVAVLVAAGITMVAAYPRPRHQRADEVAGSGAAGAAVRYNVAALGNLCALADTNPLTTALPAATRAKTSRADTKNDLKGLVVLFCVAGYESADVSLTSSADITLYGAQQDPIGAKGIYQMLTNEAKQHGDATTQHGALRGIGDAAFYVANPAQPSPQGEEVSYTLYVLSSNVVIDTALSFDYIGGGTSPSALPTQEQAQTAATAIATHTLTKAATAAKATAASKSPAVNRYAIPRGTDLCEAIDWQSLQAAMPAAGGPKPAIHQEDRVEQQIRCDGGYGAPITGVNMTASAKVTYYSSPDEANTALISARTRAASLIGPEQTHGTLTDVGEDAVFTADTHLGYGFSTSIDYRADILASNIVITMEITAYSRTTNVAAPTPEAVTTAVKTIAAAMLGRLG